LIQQDFLKAFEKVDVIAAPSAPTTAYKIGANLSPTEMYLGDMYTLAVNLAGLPAINAPVGLDDHNLPVGLQLIGNYWSESQLLSMCINTNKTPTSTPNVRQLLRRMHNGTSSKKPKSNLIDGWEVVIGIEIHTQLATKSKIFSGSSTEFGQDPNTQASLVDLAMPGVCLY
jgi:hypothetical protein